MQKLHTVVLLCLLAGGSGLIISWSPSVPAVQQADPTLTKKQAKRGLPPGTAKIWEERGDLTPFRVYWGAASAMADPLSRLPAPPFSRFEKNTAVNAWSPKANLHDSKGVKWTAKFGPESRSDLVAPRLAWALGFGCVEGYYVPFGSIEGVTSRTDLGRAKGWIEPDGSFRTGARFKRHNKDAWEVQDAQGEDLNWDEGQNPGVPPEHLSGLLLFDVIVRNYDAQPKNCKVIHSEGVNGPENWYVVSDMGASFSGRRGSKYALSDFRKETSFIKSVTGDMVEMNYLSAISAQGKIHQRIPLAHARWFRKQLEKLTDEEIQAAFDAAYATEGLNRAYASGDPLQIKEAREREISALNREEIAGFVAAVRARIQEFLQKIPA